MKRVKVSLTLKQALMLQAMAGQMEDDMCDNPQACGYTRKDTHDFINAMNKLRVAINLVRRSK